MGVNIFRAPALAMILDPFSLDARYCHTTLLDSANCEFWEDAVPYADFLNQCISFDSLKYQTAIKHLETCLRLARDDDDLKGAFNPFDRLVQSPMERQICNALHYCARNQIGMGASPEIAVSALRMEFDLLTQPTGQPLLNLLSAFELTPFYDLDRETKRVALDQYADDLRTSPSIVLGESEITVLYHNLLEATINCFAWHMLHNNLFLHQCPACGDWFARKNKHRAAFCGGSSCCKRPRSTSKETFNQKLKTLRYWKQYQTDYQFWYHRMQRGQMPPHEFDDWKVQAKILIRKVDGGLLTESKFCAWLEEQRRKA